MAKRDKTIVMGFFGIVALVMGILFLTGNLNFGGQQQTITDTGVKETPDGSIITNCAQKPSLDVSSVNAFATGTVITGTDYIKSDGSAPTTISTATNFNAGETQTAWTENTSVFCKTLEYTPGCSETKTLQPKCYLNASIDLQMFDSESNRLDSTATNNITLTANDGETVTLKFDSDGKQASMPFGGCLVVEYPSGADDVTVTGEGIVKEGCDFQLTYTPSTTANTYEVFQIAEGFDVSKFSQKIENDITIGTTTDISGTIVASYYAADYYRTNDGEYDLDIEESANGVKTKTFGLVATVTEYID